MKKIVLLTTALFMVATITFAQDGAKEAADYGVSAGFSPFGFSVSLVYNKTAKTSVFVTAGGFPTSSSPFTPNIEGIGDDYDLESGSAWMGIFVNHRPFEDNDWFRVITGIGIGSITNTLTETSGDEYTINYLENPVGYVGLGVGQRAVKGFTLGFDLGFLFGAGPQILGPDAAKIEAIGGSALFGSVLPNLQVNLGYGF